jgi:hypothetical protein
VPLTRSARPGLHAHPRDVAHAREAAERERLAASDRHRQLKTELDRASQDVHTYTVRADMCVCVVMQRDADAGS